MVLELQLARQQGQLSGETPEERFRSFVGGLRTPEVALALLGQSGPRPRPRRDSRPWF
ncbi:MAG TPA: hypothetical protein VE685_10160 [Thermoanaerobaculia bacterium]|nr:hypothetical protein [Thermoanaerobaculia bacterium]